MNFIEQLINRSGLYNPLRFSFLPNLMVEILTSKTKKNIDFYSSFLPSPSNSDNKLIFDVGANKGNKANAFAKMGYDVVCFEPERKSLETLNYRFKNSDKIRIVNKGVSDSEKELTLHVHDYRSGYNTLSDKWVDVLNDDGENRWQKKMDIVDEYTVQTITLDQLIREFGVPLYVKIDVEGHEQEVVKGLTQKVPYLTFEANLPEFIEETVTIINHLYSINASVTFMPTNHEQLVGDKWLNRDEILEFLKTTDLRVVELIAKN